MDALAHRMIRNEGTPESIWLPWLAAQKIPRTALQSLCPEQSRLVVVAPHPDDEILACGGLLALQAGRSGSVELIAVTDGEASHGVVDRVACQRLRETRKLESMQGLQKLGLTPSAVIRLGIPDGKVSDYVDDIAHRLRQILRPSDTVITTWHLDGHPDHEAVSTATARACVGLKCRLLQCPVWMWHWSYPGDARVAWGDLLRLELPEFALCLKKEALDCHQSQLTARQGKQAPVLVPSIVARAARPAEYFFR